MLYGLLYFINIFSFKQLQGFQQQALADAVVAYALNIDNLGALEGAVKQVTKKHENQMSKNH